MNDLTFYVLVNTLAGILSLCVAHLIATNEEETQT